jgi:Histidine kinase sensor domain
VFLVDPHGFNSVSSRTFPMRAYDDREREYYRAAKDGDTGLYVTAAFLGKMTGLPGFTVSRPRIIDGRFDGVVAVTLSPAYFREFYEKIALSPRYSAATLIRADGGLLVRYPEPDAPARLSDDNPLLRAARSGVAAGVFFGRSPFTGTV